MSELSGDKMGKVSDLKSVSWSFGGHSFGPCEVEDLQVQPLLNMIRSCLSRRWSFSSDSSGFVLEFDKDLLDYVDECRLEMLAILATSRRRGLLVIEVDVRATKASVEEGEKNGESGNVSKEKIDFEKKSFVWDFSEDCEGGDQENRCLPWRFSGEHLEAKVGNLEDVPHDWRIDFNDDAISLGSDFNPHDYKPVNIFDDFDNESENDDEIQNNANEFLREVDEVVNSVLTAGNDDHNEDNLASNAHGFLEMLNHVVDGVETEKTAHAKEIASNFAFGLLQENGLPWKLNLDPHENILDDLEDDNQENNAENNNANKSCFVTLEESPMHVNSEPSRSSIILSQSEDDSQAARQRVFVDSLLAHFKDNLDHVQHILDVLTTYESDSAQTLHSMGIELFRETPTLLEQFFVCYPWARNSGKHVIVANMEQEGFGNLKENDEIVEDFESLDDSIKDLDETGFNETSTRCKRKDTGNDVTEEPAVKVRRKEVAKSSEEESYSSLDDDWMDKIGLLGWKPKPSPIQFSLQVLDENFGDELFHSKRSLEKTVFGKTIDQVNENDLTYLIELQGERKAEDDLTDLIEDERKLKSVGSRTLRSQTNLTNKLVSDKSQSLKMVKKNKGGITKSRKNDKSKLSALKNNPSKLGKIAEGTLEMKTHRTGNKRNESEIETTLGESDQKSANDDREKTLNNGPRTRRKRNTMFNFNNSGRKVKKRNSGRFKKKPKMSVIKSTACQRMNKAKAAKNLIKPVNALSEDTAKSLVDSTDTAIGDSLVDIMNELPYDTIDISADNFMSEEVSEALMDDSVVKEVMSELMDDIADEKALIKSSSTEDKSTNESLDALERSKSTNSTHVELNENDWRSRTLTVEEISSIPFASPEEVSEYFSFERPRNPTPTTASTNFDFDLDLFDEVTASDCTQVTHETSPLPHPSHVTQKLVKSTPITTSTNFNNQFNSVTTHQNSDFQFSSVTAHQNSDFQFSSVTSHQNSDFQRQLRAMSTDIPERTETPLSSRPDTALESDRSSSALSTARDMPVLDW